MQVWLAAASQTTFAQLARLVLEHAATNVVARTILVDAGQQIALIARALDPAGTLPVALCGGLAAPLSAYLPAELLQLVVPAQGDSAAGGLRLIRKHLQEQ
jgi:glucosamine kinase